MTNIDVLIPKVDVDIIPIEDVYSLIIIDKSSLKHLEGKSPITLHITPPGSLTYIEVILNQKSIKLIKSDALELTSPDSDPCPLPDGIYTIKAFICGAEGVEVEVKFVRYVKLLIDHVYKKAVNSDVNDKRWDKVYKYIEHMKANATCGHCTEAMDFYERAKFEVNSI